jgi:hypothetical protein
VVVAQMPENGDVCYPHGDSRCKDQGRGPCYRPPHSQLGTPPTHRRAVQRKTNVLIFRNCRQPKELSLTMSLLSLVIGGAALIIAHDDWTDCVRSHPELELNEQEALDDLVCSQRVGADGALRVGCVGDSITAVGHASGPTHYYPAQLQDLLNATYGPDKYVVTNLGTCGTTLQKVC